uniref:Venom allergen 3 n=1 Tax=Lygus hesperus TaxID=30085 RepID=A0A0A9WD34_LYGHE
MILNTVTWCIVVLFSVGNAQKDPKWCDAKYECNGAKNILCERKVGSDQCISLSNEPKDLLLKLHRDARNHMKRDDVTKSKGLPKACYMGTLRWDPELAEMAEWYGLSCMLINGNCQKTDKFMTVARSIEVSENVTDPNEYNPIPTLTQMFGTWLESFYSAPDVTELVASYKNGSWHKGTQIVWAGTIFIGCAMSKQHRPKEHTLVMVLICNYAPPGNIEGKQIYETDCTKPPPDEERSVAHLLKPSIASIVLVLLLTV